MLIFLKSEKKKPAAGNMPGFATTTRQDRVKKSGTKPIAPALFTINEEDEQQKNGKSKKEKAPDGPYSKVQEKKMSLSQARKDNALSKSEPHLTLKVDERQRLARERREEREKLMAARESLWLEKEVRARHHYEKHLEERKKKLEEQRLKEERRRVAVDEKRRQKLEEEQVRHEAVVKRTIERSQKPKQKNNRWSWGGALQSNTSISSSDPDRRSVSTMNLSKHVDPVINKRLSTSSATLLNTPDRGRRPQLSSWESTVVSRLLTPTHSYLARSKSTAALSGDAASCSPISPQFSKTPTSKISEKAKHFFTTPEAIARRRTTHFGGTSSVEKKEKRETERGNVLLTPTSIIKRAISPKPKSSAPTSGGPSHKSSPRPVAAIVNSSIKMATTPQRPLSPGNVRPVRKDSKEDSKKKEEEMPPYSTEKGSIEGKHPLAATAEGSGEEKPRTPSPVTTETMQEPPALASPTVASKSFAGTTDPGEATRILAENRRLAREQREREEEEKREREEEERRKKEEIAQRQAKERARREEEAKQQEAERNEKQDKERQEKERLQRQQAEEKELREREEAERLQKQKEEGDRIRLQREKHFQKEEQERSERKKRLEEIMKRTRRSEAGDKPPNVQKNGEVPKPVENTAITPTPLKEEQTSVFLQSDAETIRNGESVAPSPRIVTFSQALPVDSTEKQPNENGLRTPNNNFEEIINLPVGSKPMKLDSLNNEGSSIEDLPPLNPLIAFEVDNVQAPQTTEVI